MEVNKMTSEFERHSCLLKNEAECEEELEEKGYSLEKAEEYFGGKK